MTTDPFEGLRPEDDASAAGRVARLLTGEGVSFWVPEGYERIIRIHHPLEGGVRWSDTQPQWLATGPHMPSGYPDDLPADMGRLDPELLDALVPLLRASTATADDCHFALWLGSGRLDVGGFGIYGAPEMSAAQRAAEIAATTRWAKEIFRPVTEFIERCPVYEWFGGRDFALFQGPVEAVTSIGFPSLRAAFQGEAELERLGPQWWWPEDLAWFLASEIDYPWTYLTGPKSLVDAVLDLDVEATVVQPDDRW